MDLVSGLGTIEDVPGNACCIWWIVCPLPPEACQVPAGRPAGRERGSAALRARPETGFRDGQQQKVNEWLRYRSPKVSANPVNIVFRCCLMFVMFICLLLPLLLLLLIIIIIIVIIMIIIIIIISIMPTPRSPARRLSPPPRALPRARPGAAPAPRGPKGPGEYYIYIYIYTCIHI